MIISKINGIKPSLICDVEETIENFKYQINDLKDEIERLEKTLDKKRKKLKKKINIDWYYEYNYNNIEIYINKLINKYNIYNYEIDQIKPILYNDMIEILSKKYIYYKKYNKGRYSSTAILKHNDNDIIIKKTLIKTPKFLIKCFKEMIVQHHVNKLLNLSPKVHFFYLSVINNKLYNFFGMDRIKHVFYQLFNVDKMYLCYKIKNKIVLTEFKKAIKIYIGTLEKLILNGILHNDLHDGNFCFNSPSGKLYFIDFGEVKFIKKINGLIDNEKNTINDNIFIPDIKFLYYDYLYTEIDYLIQMYFKDDSFSETKKDRYNIFYKNSYLYKIYQLLKKKQYNFGYHLQFVDSTIDINAVLNNINYKLKFKDL